MFSADFCCGNTAADAEDMMRRFANNPRYARVYFKYDGRFVLTTFAGDKQGVAGWKQIREDLASGTHPSTARFANALKSVSGPPSNAGIRIFLVPAFFWGGETPDAVAVERGESEWRNAIDGSLYWGIAGVPGAGGGLDVVRRGDAYARVVHAAGKLYMASVTVQFWGANANRYYEYSGGRGMRTMWMGAIESKADWVEIITWNDFVEGTYVSPIDDPNKYAGANELVQSGVPAGTRGYFHSHAAAGELMSYYIRWYKTGVQPKIDADRMYWFYRTQPAALGAGVPAVKNKYGPVKDVIYVTSNLTAPGTLRVESGGRVTIVEVAAGSDDVAVPFGVGDAPRFTLMRGGKVVIEAAGLDRIEAAPRYNDFYYSTGEADAFSGDTREHSRRETR